MKTCYSKKNLNTTATTCAALGSNIDPNTPTVTYKYDLIPNGKGALIETSNGVSTSKTTQIDQWGRPTEYQQITDGVTYTSSYQYNLSGAMTQETYPSGRIVKNTFDSNGDLARIHGKTNSNATERTYANGFAYTPHNKIQRLKLGNGLWEAGQFNDRLQVTELSLGNSSSDTSLWSLNYDYDEDLGNGATANTGNVIKQTVNFEGLTNPFVLTYKYDSLYRLTEAKEMAGTTENWKQNLTYDRYGNRQTHNKFINGNQIIHNNISHPTINQNTNRFNTGQGYEYDKVGNLTKDADNRNFAFDGNNKQTIIRNNSGAKIGEYFYDGVGKRIKKKVYDSNQNVIEETIFVYSLGKLSEEYSTATPPTNPTTNYTITDKVGSPRVLADAEGNIKSRRDFMPFGEKIDDTIGERSNQLLKHGQTEDNVRQKFTGYERDDETGLDFAQARMYNNQHARFTAVDPLLASGNNTNPQTYNRYAYVMNSPLQYIDPTGEISTHIDKDGNVITVIDDGDKGVYQHGDNADGGTPTETMIKRRQSIYKSTSANGTKIGETEYWDEFREHNGQTGEVGENVASNARIIVGTSFDGHISVLNQKAKNTTLALEVAFESTTGGEYDIKRNKEIAPNGFYTGRLLNGKYATARSAGNYLAGYNGATIKSWTVKSWLYPIPTTRYLPEKEYMQIAGALHKDGKEGAVKTALTGKSNYSFPYYGEIEYAGRQILAGFRRGVSERNQ